jgi:hypothetical protein
MIRNIKIIIITCFIISVLFSFYTVKEFDKSYISYAKTTDHYLIKGDIDHYFKQAKSFEESMKNKKIFSNHEYVTSYLHPRIISLIYCLTNTKIEINSEINNNILLTLKNTKFIFLFLQTLVYYFSIFFFSKCLNKKIHPKVLFILIIFLSIEPNLIQWNSSFFSESLFLSLLIILIGLLINIDKSMIKNLFIGLLVGLMYLQKTVMLLILLPILVYYLFQFKIIKIALKAFVFVTIGKGIILLFLGYDNYQRSGVFYLIPWQTKFSGYHYLVDNVVSKSDKITSYTAKENRLLKEREWIISKNLNLEIEKDRRKLYDYQNKYFLNTIKNYPYQTLNYIFYKSAQTLILEPFGVYKFIKTDLTVPQYWKLASFRSDLIFNVIYSFIIYFIIFIGFLHSIKNIKLELIVLHFLLGIYFLFMLGWVGVSRYSVPSLMCFGIFFANGIFYLYKRFTNKINNYSLL